MNCEGGYVRYRNGRDTIEPGARENPVNPHRCALHGSFSFRAPPQPERQQRGPKETESEWNAQTRRGPGLSETKLKWLRQGSSGIRKENIADACETAKGRLRSRGAGSPSLGSFRERPPEIFQLQADVLSARVPQSHNERSQRQLAVSQSSVARQVPAADAVV